MKIANAIHGRPHEDARAGLGPALAGRPRRGAWIGAACLRPAAGSRRELLRGGRTTSGSWSARPNRRCREAYSDKLWPDFDAIELERALSEYASRQRRFGAR